VLLTTYELVMGREDRPCLSKVKWAYIVVDEGHRLKNVGCKLATELKLFKADNRLLITGNLISARLMQYSGGHVD
jgi:SNF2 family DNA or RNA helicase